MSFPKRKVLAGNLPIVSFTTVGKRMVVVFIWRRPETNYTKAFADLSEGQSSRRVLMILKAFGPISWWYRKDQLLGSVSLATFRPAK